MPVMLECVSHTPVMNKFGPAAEIDAEISDVLAGVRARVDAFAPDLVVLFGPDHFNTFFYNVMPCFCIGARTTSIGDYGTTPGTLPVPEAIAVACARSVLAADVDVALSHNMRVDHGFAQPLTLLTGGIEIYPVIPVFINSIAAPLPSCRRAARLGAAIGSFLSTQHAEKRILLIGSGGMSHDPPVPNLETAGPEQQEALIQGRVRSGPEQAAHEEKVVAAAKAFTTVDAYVGGGRLQALNPAWDRKILDQLCANDSTALAALTDDEIFREGGSGAHEIRTWIAAFACLAAFGAYTADVKYYRPVPEWIAGFAVAEARSGR